MPAYHFINLVCWEQFDEYYSLGDQVFLDSRSICLVARVVGRSASRFPGVSMASEFRELKPLDNVYRLTAHPSNAIKNSSFCLEMIEDIRGYSVQGALLDFLLQIPKGKDLLIGISSPKQNILAKKILQIRPDLHVFCLGAALNMVEQETNVFSSIPILSEQEWLKFLILHPLRTIKKILFTFIEVFRILWLPEVKKRFLGFLENATLNNARQTLSLRKSKI